MARYTAELREIVNSGVNIFNFNYPFYDENKRADFEKRFIQHFYFREIGQETVGRFMHYLEVNCNEKLPYYNEVLKLLSLEYDVLNNYSLTETMDRTDQNTKSQTGNIKANGTSSNNVTSGNTTDSTTDSTVSDQKTNSIDSTTTHTEDTDNTHTETVTETGKIDKTENVIVDGKAVDSDTPSGLLSMTDIKNNVYASKANIQDNTTDTTDSETSSADKNTNTEDKTTSTVNDKVTATSTDNGNSHNTETNHTTSSGTEQNNGTSTANTDTTQNENNTENENYTMTRIGNIGVMTPADMLEKHVEIQRKIRTAYLQFFNECDELFMQIF